MNNQQSQLREPIPVAVLGATGAVGQRFVQLLDNHPWFKVVALTGSERAIGKSYAQACHWILSTPMPEWARDISILPAVPEDSDVPLVFSALPSTSAYEVEPYYARRGVIVCSNASAFRAEPDVPLVLPEVNPEHNSLISHQREKRGWPGAIVTNANCTITGLTIVLKALSDQFGIKQAFVVSMQAVSGAGYPGVSSMDILGNVVPYISDEEEKMEWEPRKIMGTAQGDRVELANFEITTHANRVPVLDGHMVCLSIKLAEKGSTGAVAEALRGYLGPPISRELPSAPPTIIQLKDEPDRPQPRLDIMTGSGMNTLVGRLREDPVLDYKMVILSHNTIRGAAGASIYNAELLVKQGFIKY